MFVCAICYLVIMEYCIHIALFKEKISLIDWLMSTLCAPYQCPIRWKGWVTVALLSFIIIIRTVLIPYNETNFQLINMFKMVFYLAGKWTSNLNWMTDIHSTRTVRRQPPLTQLLTRLVVDFWPRSLLMPARCNTIYHGACFNDLFVP